MGRFADLQKLKKGDKVAILSPSFAAPGKWPWVYELGLKRMRDLFGLEPVEFPTTKKIGATADERSKDLISAFENKDIKAVIASLGGNDLVTYIKDLPKKPFLNDPKPFFGFSDNTHFCNFLWLLNIPSFYGGMLFTQYAKSQKMDDFTVRYLHKALFDGGETEITRSDVYNDIELSWDDPENLNKARHFESNDGWYWDGRENGEGILWGGCLESIDEILRNGIEIPSLNDFENIVLFTETSEEIPSAEYVYRVYRALGEKGILEKIKGILVGRAKAWAFDIQNNAKKKAIYRKEQREAILGIVRKYNENIPVVQNLDFGHTDPQIPMPYGGKVRLLSSNKQIFATF